MLPIRFPDPGKPEGIRTFRKPVITLKDVSFKYDGSEKTILSKVRWGHGAWAWGMGHGAWGMGHGAWGMGST